MKIQDQCITLDQAKRLNELAVRQDVSYFIIDANNEILERWMLPKTPKPFFALFTVAELGEMLPNGYDTMRVTGHTPHLYIWRGYDLDGKDCPCDKGYRTEAACRGAMLIHLLETNTITPNQVNERLKQ